MKIVIYLQLKVNQFCSQDEHFNIWRRQFPGLEVIHAKSREEYERVLPECEGAAVWAFREKDYAKAPKLRFILTPAAGRDWVAEDPKKRVKVFFSRFHGPLIGESLLAGLLAVNNRIIKQHELQRQRVWDRNSTPGRQLLRGRRVLIYGFGSIGLHCARLLQSLGMQVAGVNRSGSCRFTCDTRVLTLLQAKEELAQTDIVISLVPDCPRPVFDKDFFKQLKCGAIFASFGRGSSVDETALTEALQNNVSAAVLDVTAEEPAPPDSPLYMHENVLLTPHNSCCYEEYIPLFAEEWSTRLKDEGLIKTD